MENQIPGVSRTTASFGLALAVASVADGLLVIAKEKSPAVMAGMQHFTGHHWITHSIVVLALFAGSGWCFGRLDGGRGPGMAVGRLLAAVLFGVVAGSLLIVGFYLFGG
jgi:hypothetical protein